MESRNTTSSDLAKVFRNNAPRINSEYERAGVKSRQVKSNFLAAAVDGRCHTLLQDGVPMAAIMWDPVEELIITSFAAKEEFFTSETVRFCRKHIHELQRENGGVPVHAYSYSTHSRVARWFEALGFEPVNSDENSTLYQLAAVGV